MAVPKKKKSAAKSKQHRAHTALTATSITTCPKCGEKMRPHNVCPSCGFYAGKQVVSK